MHHAQTTRQAPAADGGEARMMLAGFRVARLGDDPADPRRRRIGADLIAVARRIEEGFLLPDRAEREALKLAYADRRRRAA